MEEKLFELLEKLYIKVETMEKSMATKDELNEIRQSMATKDELNEIRQSLVRLENKIDTNHKALYDGYKLNYEKLNIFEKKIDEIGDKVDRQDVEIRVIKGAK